MAKRMGRQCKLRADWEEIKLQVMETLLRQKFHSEINPALAQLLKNTRDYELIEGNNWGDTFWGVCNKVGKNHLGRLLMLIRSDL